jgi:hypothetical protein
VTPEIGSALLIGQGPDLGGFFLTFPLVQVPAGSVTGVNTPAPCDAALEVEGMLEALVVVLVDDCDDCDDCDDNEDDEFARCTLLRGMNIRASSSSV